MSPPRVAKVNPPFALTLYRLVAWLLGRLLTAKWRRRGRVEPRYLHDIPARFGHYQHPSGVGYIWIHAVSLGETRACVPLLDAVRAQWPGQPLLLTHGTATGWEAGNSLLRPGDLQTWLPWDEPAAVKRFLTHHQPRLGMLMETEVWPELTTQCAALQVPLFLVNARLSDRSLGKALRLSSLAKWVFSRLAGVVPQTAPDAQRLQRLDAPVLASSGNIKFDVSINNIQLEKGREWRASLNKPVLMLASSREGEEAALISALNDPVHDAYFDVGAYHWLVVPRHPNRVEAVVALFTAAGFTVRRRSVWGADVPDAPEVVDSKVIWLGDTLGEMPLYYGLADVALLGEALVSGAVKTSSKPLPAAVQSFSDRTHTTLHKRRTLLWPLVLRCASRTCPRRSVWPRLLPSTHRYAHKWPMQAPRWFARIKVPRNARLRR